VLGWSRALRAPGRGAPAPGSSAAARIGCAGPGAATGWKSLTWPEGRSAAGLSPGAQDRGAEPPTLLVQAPGRPEPAYRGPVVVPVGLCWPPRGSLPPAAWARRGAGWLSPCAPQPEQTAVPPPTVPPFLGPWARRRGEEGLALGQWVPLLP